MGVYPRALTSDSSDDSVAFGQFQSPHTRRSQLDVASEESQMVHVTIDEPSQTSADPKRRAEDRLVVDTRHPVPLSLELKLSMACCQSLAIMDGELIGDPLEVQTFEASNAHMQDTGDLQGFQQLVTFQLSVDQSVAFGVREQFEFSSALARMSVLVENLLTHEEWVFAKGSPEVMQTLCRPETIPQDYAAVLSYFAHQGYRVIAIGQRKVSNVPRLDKNDLRAHLEQQLDFLGLIVLENKLKPESKPTLQQLHDAAVRVVMVTGDHPATGCTVSRDCGLVRPGTRIFLSTLVHDQIEWVDIDDETLRLDPVTLALPHRLLAESPDGKVPYELAVTGPVFKKLQEDPRSANDDSLFKKVILNGQVFARMSPDQKASLISELQNLGIYTGMCGDGRKQTISNFAQFPKVWYYIKGQLLTSFFFLVCISFSSSSFCVKVQTIVAP